MLCTVPLFTILILWIKSLRAIKEIYWAVLFCGAVYCAVNDGSNVCFWEWNFHNVTIEMKANVHYFSVVLFIMFYMVILHVTFYPNPFKSTLAWNHLFSTTLLNYIGISLVFSVRNTSLASKRIIQTWLSNSHGCDVIHVCRQLNAATIIECKSREWCVAFLLAWYDT